MSKCTNGVEASSPLATIEDIHKRLTRPPPSSSVTASHLFELQHENASQSKLNVDTYPLQKQRKLTRAHDNQSSSSVIAPHLYELQHQNSTYVDTSQLQKRRKSRAVKVKLEDYFDQSLLSAIRTKMKSSLKKQSREMKLKSEFEKFVWPAAPDDHRDSELFLESSRKNDEAIVDLKNDDNDDDTLWDDEKKNHVIGVDPFQRFESTALMRFKR